MSVRKVSIPEAKQIINDNNLRPAFDVWHYSFNLEIFYDHLYYRDEPVKAVLPERAMGVWSPLPVFSEQDIYPDIPNALTGKAGDFKEGKRYFWYTRTGSFDEYLESRTAESSKKKKHFPTTYTYRRAREKLGDAVEILPVDLDYFISTYNRLKRPSHCCAEDIVNHKETGISACPVEWLKMSVLRHEGEVRAIGLYIDDGKSMSLLNLASEMNPLSLGNYMCVEVIRYCCENNYQSFDCGISVEFGYYKRRIFTSKYNVFQFKP